MLKTLKRNYYAFGASLTMGVLMADKAFAQNDFSKISKNIVTSMQDAPGALTGAAYIGGLGLGILGIGKIKAHVENPGNTPLKDGAIRLAAGGALFALPIMYESAFNTIGTGTTTKAATLNKINFAVQ